MGYTKLKPPQEEIITEYVLGKDVFVSLPTGFGKSICYGCLPIVFDKLRGLDEKSIALIITPLISLMTDQVSSFTSKGLKAGFIGTGMNKKTVDAVMNGQYQLLFISPEALLESRRWRDILNCCICYRRKYIFPSPLAAIYIVLQGTALAGFVYRE